MDTLENRAIKALVRYEKARQEVRDLKKKRRELLDSCINPDGQGYKRAFNSCLQLAFIEMKCYQKEGYQADFYEVLHGYIDEDVYCAACKESYDIKTGSLADAKQELGAAKRSIAGLGKSLIKGAI